MAHPSLWVSHPPFGRGVGCRYGMMDVRVATRLSFVLLGWDGTCWVAGLLILTVLNERLTAAPIILWSSSCWAWKYGSQSSIFWQYVFDMRFVASHF